MPSIKLHWKELEEILEEEWSREPERFVETELVDTDGRWTENYAMIFKHDGKFYSACYQVGATECQELEAQDRWGAFGEGLIECTEVERVTVTKEIWQDVQ